MLIASGRSNFGLNGMTFPVQIVTSTGSKTTTALIDTGSTYSSVDSTLLTSLGAATVGQTVITTAAGPKTVSVYAGSIWSNSIHLNSSNQLIGDTLPSSIGALIGRDILDHADLVENQGVWSLSTPTPFVATPYFLGGAAILSISAGLFLMLGEHIGKK